MPKVVRSPMPEPCYYHNDGTVPSQITKFFDYGQPILYDAILECVKLATSHALRHQGDDPIAIGHLMFWAEGTELMMFPGEQLTWQQWRGALQNILYFAKWRGMTYELSFLILLDGKSENLTKYFFGLTRR